jgi:hypothetical protein
VPFLNKKIFQRAFLAFTTGLFLACAAQISSADATTVNTSVTTSR